LAPARHPAEGAKIPYCNPASRRGLQTVVHAMDLALRATTPVAARLSFPGWRGVSPFTRRFAMAKSKRFRPADNLPPSKKRSRPGTTKSTRRRTRRRVFGLKMGRTEASMEKRAAKDQLQANQPEPIRQGQVMRIASTASLLALCLTAACSDPPRESRADKTPRISSSPSRMSLSPQTRRRPSSTGRQKAPRSGIIPTCRGSGSLNSILTTPGHTSGTCAAPRPISTS
jgi:hypothetical protein